MSALPADWRSDLPPFAIEWLDQEQAVERSCTNQWEQVGYRVQRHWTADPNGWPVDFMARWPRIGQVGSIEECHAMIGWHLAFRPSETSTYTIVMRTTYGRNQPPKEQAVDVDMDRATYWCDLIRSANP